MRTLPRAAAAAVVLALTVMLLAPGDGAPGAAAAAPVARESTAGRRARSVLVISLPAISWTDVRDAGAGAPTLARLFRESAIADLSTRSIRQRTGPANGYTAIGAGARAIADPGLAGQNLAAAEDYGDDTAGAVFRRRTGRRLATTVGALGIASIEEDNAKQPYDAVPGTLGGTLRRAGIARAVVANADEDELQPSAQVLHREAALALMDETGRVPGTVTPDLLEPDPAAPFGLRLDPDRVVAALPPQFLTSRRSVALVEASDLARVNAYRPLAAPRQRAAQRASALRATDRLVARLLEEVDVRRDAVLVVAPYHTGRRRELTVAALRAPGVEPGYLTSATTRRDGFVQIVDVAPTIVDLLGLERPDEMEGRPFEPVASPRGYAGRVSFLVRANREAVFRDSTIGLATAVLIVTSIALVIAALLVLHRGWRVGRRLLEWGGLALLGYLTATFVAGVFPFDRWGSAAYWVFVAVFSVLFAGACLLAGRRDRADPVIVALAAVVVLHVLDALTGAHLELNTVFGYTGTVGIRLAGLGNPGSAQLTAATVLLATLLAWRLRARTGVRVADGLLVLVLLIVGSPIWGQDFGGAISAAPAFGLLALGLSGRRVTARAVAGLGGALVAVGLAVGIADLTRPADRRTHVGRFFEKVGDEGLSGFTTVVGRKATLMARTFSNTGWVVLVLVVVAVIAYAAWRTDWLRRIVAWIPTMRPGLEAFMLLAVLSTVLNDSGVQVLGMMIAVLAPTLVFLASRSPEPSP